MGKKSKMTAIEIAGRTLWGSAWQENMAQALEVTPKTIWRWKEGADIPEGVWSDLPAVCDRRIAEIEKLKRAIKESRAKQGA